jgi:hypothetical protein
MLPVPLGVREEGCESRSTVEWPSGMGLTTTCGAAGFCCSDWSLDWTMTELRACCLVLGRSKSVFTVDGCAAMSDMLESLGMDRQRNQSMTRFALPAGGPVLPTQFGSFDVVEEAAVESARVLRAGAGTDGLVVEAWSVVDRVLGFSSCATAVTGCTLTDCLLLDLALPVAEPLNGSTTMLIAFRLEPFLLLVSSSSAGDSAFVFVFAEPSLLRAMRSLDVVDVPSRREMEKRSAELGLCCRTSVEPGDFFGEGGRSDILRGVAPSFLSRSGDGNGTLGGSLARVAVIGVVSPAVAATGSGSTGITMLCRLARGVACP